MKIAISGLSSLVYGGQTYFKNIILALSQIDKINEYHIFIPPGSSLVKTIDQKNFVFYECSFNVNSGLKRFFWEQTIFPIMLRKKEIDIVFAPKNINTLFAPCKSIIAILNVLPFYYKNYKSHWKMRLRLWFELQFTKFSIKRANKVIAISHATGSRLRKIFPKIKDKLAVIYPGNSITDKSLRARTSFNDNNFILSSSKFIPYANQLNLIKGYALLNKKNRNLPSLWLAGGVHDLSYFKKVKKVIKENNLVEKIKILGLIPREQLIELYSKALIFIFPSKLESCPLTLLEVMACGMPIVTSNAPPMPEICEKAAVYFNPDNPDDIADKILQVLQNNSLRQQLKKESIERSKYFSWEKTAKQTLEVFEKVFNQ